MPTPSSGQMRLRDDIAAVSLGSSYAGALTTNVGMSNYFRGGTYIPNVSMGNNTVTTPTSLSNMSFSNYYSVWGYKRFSFNMTNAKGTWSDGKNSYTYAGYSGASGSGAGQNPFLQSGMPSPFGSLSATQFTTPNGTMTICGFYWPGGSGYNGTGALILQRPTSAPPNDDLTFISGFNGMGSTSFSRTQSTNNNTFSNFRSFSPSSSTTFGNWAGSTGGTVYSCYLNYYG